MGPRWACKIDSGLRCWVFVKRGVAIIPGSLCRQQLADAWLGYSLDVGAVVGPKVPPREVFQGGPWHERTSRVSDLSGRRHTCQ